ncbi:MAG: glycosyltransferase, partial [Terriglobia bacterium]
MELIVRLHRWARNKRMHIRTFFAMDSVCWTNCPKSLSTLARQRRRWQLGLCQSLWLNSEMLFNPKYGAVGMFSFPFHLYIEGLGAAVELTGYAVVPLAFALHLALSAVYIPLVILSLVYAAFLSAGAVALEELTYKRYPAKRDLAALLGWALVENFGFRQLVLYYRFQGFVRFLAGFEKWETVTRTAEAEA